MNAVGGILLFVASGFLVILFLAIITAVWRRTIDG